MSKREEIRQRRQQERRRGVLTGVIIVAGIALVIGALVIFRTQSTISSIEMAEFYNYPDQTEWTSMGDPDAPVIIEEFADFQCSACAFFHEETVAQVVDNYVNTGEVYFVYRNFPVIDARAARKESHTAGLAGYCAAEQGRFWEYHDMLFANRIGENAGSYTTARLEAIAEILGLDPDFNDCLSEERYRDQLNEDIQLGQQAGVNSTPSFLINGRLIVGAFSYDQFSVEIESALAEAGG